MRTFACARCDQLVFLEYTECLNCGAGLLFRWADRELVTLTDEFVGPARCANLEPRGATRWCASPASSASPAR